MRFYSKVLASRFKLSAIDREYPKTNIFLGVQSLSNNSECLTMREVDATMISINSLATDLKPSLNLLISLPCFLYTPRVMVWK